MAAIVNLTKCQPQKEKVSDYLERVSLYFVANGVAEWQYSLQLLEERCTSYWLVCCPQQSHVTRLMQK